MEIIKENELTDEELAKKVQAGETEYFRELMSRYEGKIIRYGRRFLQDAEEVRDIAQNVFVKVYKNIQSFDTSQRFSPWIYRIAHNESVNTLKRKVREPLGFFDPEVLFPHPVAAENPEKDAERGELKKILEECFQDLDDKYREVLALRYFEDMDYKDIAEVLQVPVVTVGVRLNRGRDRLRQIYERKINGV